MVGFLWFGSNFLWGLKGAEKKLKKALRKAELGWFCVAGGDTSSRSLLRTDGEGPSEPQDKTRWKDTGRKAPAAEFSWIHGAFQVGNDLSRPPSPILRTSSTDPHRSELHPP